MKNLVTFILGAAAGAVATKIILEKKYREEADAEIAEMRAYTSDYIAKMKKEINEKMKESMIDKIMNDSTNKYEDVMKEVAQNNQESAKEAENIVALSLEEAEETGALKFVEPEFIPYDESNDQTYYITEHEFQEQNNYEKIELYLYLEDKVIADENDDKENTPDIILGPDSINSLIDMDGDTLYMRNDKDESDYVIIKVRGSYKRDVLGEE